MVASATTTNLLIDLLGTTENGVSQDHEGCGNHLGRIGSGRGRGRGRLGHKCSIQLLVEVTTKIVT